MGKVISVAKATTAELNRTDSTPERSRFLKARAPLILLVFVTMACARNPVDPYPLRIGGGTIDIDFQPGDFSLGREKMLAWVNAAATSVEKYYGRFPLTHTALHIRSFAGNGVRGGKTFGSREGGLIYISVGKRTDETELRQDWEMTHEMIHLTFPSVADQHHWIEEGIATYVEPIARARAGYLEPAQVWGDMVRDMPQGLPEAGDRGLDHTPTWGRTYWGGAIFCLLADMEIRQRTHNQKGLEHALRGILDDGGNITQTWELERALQVGDRAAGVPVLQELYQKMKDKPVEVDLDGLWKQLGVERQGGHTSFNNTAPLAAVRLAITTGESSH
ncbi:MAG TPA: hypothetical protein VK473_05975 [Terriglobales bacterium]|nr:hypothetical protein [Terriglobales bacterium]